MIPILYEKNERDFITNGVCRLIDILDGFVEEERNGIYECEFKYPVTGEHFSDIQEGRVICAWHDDSKTIQPFDIYGRSAPMDGVVTFYAHHISYRLGKICVRPFTAGSCLEAFAKFQPYSMNTNPFTFWTDKSVESPFDVIAPSNLKGLLGGQERSILDVYGKGDYEWDKYTVKLHLNRGQDNGVSIRYGKNLTKLTHNTDISEAYNAVAPYWLSYEGDLVELPEGYITCSSYEEGQEILCVPMDLSDRFDEAPTEAELRSLAQSILDGSESWTAKDTVDIDFINLWESHEYETYKSLQRVCLCDKVTVINPKMDLIKIKMEVVKAKYNFVTERYDSMTLGTPKTSFADAINASTEELIADLPNKSFMQAAIDYATKLIQGGLGGHVVFNTNAAGQPEEILIMDTDDTRTAVNVWRFNLGGLGHSHSGYNGPFNDIALTMDGRINATMITTGILNAGIIKAGILTDALGKNWWNLDTGEIHIDIGDSIDIGGRNLLPMTKAYGSYPRSYSRSVFNLTADRDIPSGWFSVQGSYDNPTATYASDLFTIWSSHSSSLAGEKINSQCILSCEFDGEMLWQEQSSIRIGYKDISGTTKTLMWNIYTSKNKTFVINDLDYITEIVFYITIVKGYSGSIDWKFRMQLERGNVATDWSPAPEDLEAGISDLETKYTTLDVTVDGISTEVGKKVGNNEIISKINQSAEQVQIEASKLSFSGKTIDLSTDNIVLKSSSGDGEVQLYYDPNEIAIVDEYGHDLLPVHLGGRDSKDYGWLELGFGTSGVVRIRTGNYLFAMSSSGGIAFHGPNGSWFPPV